MHRCQVWAYPKAFLLPLCSDFGSSGSHDQPAHDVHTSPGLPRFGITGIALASVLTVLCIAAGIGEQPQMPCNTTSDTCLAGFTSLRPAPCVCRHKQDEASAHI